MLQVGRIFQSGMVLQQGKSIQIWGSAEAGAEVVIELQNRKTTVKSDEDGQWRGELQQSFDETMSISCGEEKMELSDLAVGEVWLPAGSPTWNTGCTMRSITRKKGSTVKIVISEFIQCRKSFMKGRIRTTIIVPSDFGGRPQPESWNICRRCLIILPRSFRQSFRLRWA